MPQNFRKIHQGEQGLWIGPADGAESFSPPQELEKARETGYFSSV